MWNIECHINLINVEVLLSFTKTDNSNINFFLTFKYYNCYILFFIKFLITKIKSNFY